MIHPIMAAAAFLFIKAPCCSVSPLWPPEIIQNNSDNQASQFVLELLMNKRSQYSMTWHRSLLIDARTIRTLAYRDVFLLYRDINSQPYWIFQNVLNIHSQLRVTLTHMYARPPRQRDSQTKICAPVIFRSAWESLTASCHHSQTQQAIKIAFNVLFFLISYSLVSVLSQAWVRFPLNKVQNVCACC